MLLRELFEGQEKTATIIYGRMNPPTIGHKRLMEELKSVAAKNGADAIVFLSHTQNKKTDPLTFDQKIMYAQQMFPDITFAEDQNSKTFPGALKHLQDAGYTKIIHLVGSDRLMGFKAITDAYNGKPDKSGAIPFKFNEYEFVSLDRDPDAEGATGMSASKARALAAAGDVESFKLAVPGDDRLTMALYRDVREGLGIKETEPAESTVEDATRAEAQAAYMQGECMILAVAINQLNPERYPIGYIWEYNMSAGVPDMQLDDDEWESLSPQEQQEISKDISRHSVVHAYVRDQETGEYIDARGRHKTLPNLWGRLGQTRFEEFPGTARELIDITAHGDWDEVGEQVSFKRGQPAFDSLAGPAGIKRAQDYAVKYLGVEVSKNKTPGTDQQGVAESTVEDAAGVGVITKQNTTKDVNKGTLRKMMKAFHLIDNMYSVLTHINEAPIEMDPADPMDPMIYGHDKANPGKLKYRMLRASKQLRDLADRAKDASPSEWQTISRQFSELVMNIEQIKHGLDELVKVRRRGGIKSRGIDPMIDSVDEGCKYGRYYCSTDKKWKCRTAPKQSRNT